MQLLILNLNRVVFSDIEWDYYRLGLGDTGFAVSLRLI